MRGSRRAAPLDRGQAILTGRPNFTTATALAAALFAVSCSHWPGETTDAPRASDIRALLWLDEGADAARFLTTRPAPCEHSNGLDIVRIRDHPPQSFSYSEAGKLAFESPALLGGAAARMGLSCSSCHLNGRGNPDFFVKGVSDQPGRADVTSSLFSRVRGDGNFNPVPIPDIAARDGKQIRDRTGAEFRVKVHGLVVEEFDGREPPSKVFDALIVYLDTLDISGCSGAAARVPVTAEDDLHAAERAVEIASMMGGEDGALMARVARSRLERLYERFIAPDQSEVRNAVIAASRAIETWSAGLGQLRHAPKPEAELARVGELVRRHEAKSLYNPEVLRAALASE